MSFVVPQPNHWRQRPFPAANEVYPLTAPQFAVRTQMYQGVSSFSDSAVVSSYT
jgi:hypothetical protein